MNKICTTIEQSKKLLELGIDINTADMYWLNRPIDLTQTKYALFVVDKSDKHIDFFNSYAVAVEKGEIIPAWSLTALLGLMPQTIDKDDKWLLRLQRCYHRDVLRFIFTYPNTKSTPVCDNPLDAAFEMVVWLKENGKL